EETGPEARLPVRSKNSCGFTCIVFQEPPEPFTTLNGTCTFCVLADWRKEEHVVLALVIALVMEMRHILRQRMAERCFAKQDELCETLLFDRAYAPLLIRIQIGRPRWQWHPCHSSLINDTLKCRAVFPVPIMDQLVAG